MRHRHIHGFFEEYMREHPMECRWCGKTKREHLGFLRNLCFNANDSTSFEPPIPPTKPGTSPEAEASNVLDITPRRMKPIPSIKEPWGEGGYAPPEE
jgi:hypothetical protein